MPADKVITNQQTINGSEGTVVSSFKKPKLLTKTIQERAQKLDLLLSEALKTGKRTNETEFQSLVSKALKNTTEAS